jgi:hypothetical protein
MTVHFATEVIARLQIASPHLDVEAGKARLGR